MTAALLALALLAGPAKDDLAVAWLQDARVRASGAPAEAPLGSLWKLFVFAYAVDRGLDLPDYRCGSPRRPGEEYCCEPGGTIGRDRALARSCGRFYEPSRLGIDGAAWRAYWTGRTHPQAAWLEDLGQLKPETRLAPGAILHALAAVPEPARVAASRALLPVVVETDDALAHLGGSLRVKTFTWEQQGGGAGWLVDGTPVWFSGRGGSRQVLRRHAARLAAALPAPREARLEDACVAVDYFDRYPIRSVDRMPSKQPAPAGALHGPHRVLFENGNALTLTASGELRLDRDGPRPRLRGRLRLSEYVARVLDREANPEFTEAARALAVVARTWVVQNAPFQAGCYQVDDSTRMQRVSASPATPAARRAAAFTEGLVLRGEPVRYQLAGAAPGVMGWMDAVQQAERGRGYDAILAAAFPRATLGAESGEVECRRLHDVETWLARAVPRWRRRLAAEPGFEPPEQALTVCALDAGNPYSDRERLRVHVRGLATPEDRVTLAHEYVHLGMRYHPRGTDEAYVERLARRLAEE